MKILKGIEILGKALWLKKSKTLVIADLHIGYEESLNKQGILVPRMQFKEIKKELTELMNKIKKKFDTLPRTMVINGDLKHEFGEISQQEWNETLAILDLLSKYCKKIVLIKGNHDTILEPIARRKNLKIIDYYCISNDEGKEGICILHGNKILSNSEINSAKILIIGHEHPAISLREEPKQEKYKCFLLGKWKKKQKLIVMPSFLPIIEGADIRKEKLLSPYLHQNLDNFEVFVPGDKIYRFGKLKKIR